MMYPLKFNPIFKEKIWGGNKLKTELNKCTKSSKTGESWEISSVEGSVSVVSNGIYAGKSLQEICKDHGNSLLGEKINSKFKANFPLLIKFIDASEALSIQVHPDNETANERYGLKGKTEMWYVLQADKNSELISGIGKETDLEDYRSKLEENKITDLLNFEEVKKGDAFFIPAGRIHAIGSGILLAEIQQSSDITYRIHDWNRMGINGKPRELHTQQAEDVIDFKLYNNYKSYYATQKGETSQIESCQFFTVNYLDVDNKVKKDYSALDSFVIYMCLEGDLLITCSAGEFSLTKGETILLPCMIKEYDIVGSASVLEVYI